MKNPPSDLRFHLPCSCGKTVAVRLTQAGDTVRCECGAALAVPSRGKLLLLECSAPEGKFPSRRRPTWTARQRCIMAGCVMVVISLAWLAWLRATQPSMIDFRRAPLEIVWPYWQQLRQGLDRYLSPAERKMVEMTNHSRFFQAAALGLALLGAIFSVVSFVRHEAGPRIKRKY